MEPQRKVPSLINMVRGWISGEAQNSLEVSPTETINSLLLVHFDESEVVVAGDLLKACFIIIFRVGQSN